MMRGLPASGKSTKAKELCITYGNYVRVNRDLFRDMLHFGEYSGRNEALVVESEKEIALTAFKNDINVLVDDCNLSDKNRQMWEEFAKKNKAKFEVCEMGTNYTDCIVRDSEREKKVGKSVIMNMALQYKMIPKEYSIVICDIDGTLADLRHRIHYVQTSPKDWRNFFSHIMNDGLIVSTVQKIDRLMRGYDKPEMLVLVSARPEEYRKETELWLELKGVDYATLIMRKTGDRRPDTQVKSDIYETYLKHYSIRKVFDDRPSVIRMWRSYKLNVEDCGNGEEF